MTTNNQAFYYVDGIPTKGKWIDLEFIDSTDEILEELAEAGFIGRNEEGGPEYGGDLLVADVEGDLAACFMGKYGTFDLDDFVEARDEVSEDEQEAAAKYIEHFGSWSKSHFRDAYRGEYSSEEDYAEQFIDDCGMLGGMPEDMKQYFDYERYAHDLFMGDCVFLDGHVFVNR